MARKPLTEEQKAKLREQLAKARATRKAKLEGSLPDVPQQPENEVKDEATSPPITPKTAEVAPQATPTAYGYSPDRPVVLVSLLDNQLEVCIRDVCWRGKEIVIDRNSYLSITRNETEDRTPYMTIVEEVERLLREGGYKFVRKG